mgnify:FL=1
MTIQIAVDHVEAEQFAAWLNAQGHSATIGNSTGNYVNGAWTGCNADANEIMNGLWDAYCNQ